MPLDLRTQVAERHSVGLLASPGEELLCSKLFFCGFLRLDVVSFYRNWKVFFRLIGGVVGGVSEEELAVNNMGAACFEKAANGEIVGFRMFIVSLSSQK